MKKNYNNSVAWAIIFASFALPAMAVSPAADHNRAGDKMYAPYFGDRHKGKSVFGKSRARFQYVPQIKLTAKQPKQFTLIGNHPNPFNPNTNIEFELYQHSLVRLEIYNLIGQPVATLLNGPMDAGMYHVRWNGMDDGGKELASGIYLLLLQAGSQKARKTMLLLR